MPTAAQASQEASPRPSAGPTPADGDATPSQKRLAEHQVEGDALRAVRARGPSAPPASPAGQHDPSNPDAAANSALTGNAASASPSDAPLSISPARTATGAPPAAESPPEVSPRGGARFASPPWSGDVAELAVMNLKDLRSAYTQLYGFRTGSKNLHWLRAKLAEREGAAGACAAASLADCSRPPPPRALAAILGVPVAAAAAAAAAAAGQEAGARPRRAAGVPARFVAEPKEAAAPAAAASALPHQSRVSTHFPAARRSGGPRTKARSAGGGTPRAPPPQPSRLGVPARCVALPRITLGDSTLSVGDSVFVLTAAGLRAEVTCAACGRADPPPPPGFEPDPAGVLVECGRCLSGFHLRCARLSGVPAGDWACAACAQLPAAPPPTDMARLDAGLLFLARIDSLWWDAAARDYYFRARWYHAPPRGATRWWAAGAALREVCLGPPRDADAAPVSSVVRRAAVLSPAAARAAAAAGAASQPGGPPLVCHRSYDPATRAFLPLQR